MQNLSFKSFIFLTLLLSIFSCSKNETPKPVSIAPTFQKYVDIFLSEGSKRGVNINLSDVGITLQFGETTYNGKTYGGLTTNETQTININKTYWDNYSELSRESLILHELGHLLLKRIHKSTVLGNNEAQSLMASSDDSNFKSYPIYQGFRKKYYLDELFNSSTPTPEWATSELINIPEPTTPKTLVHEQNFDKALPISTLLANYTFFDFADGKMSIKNTAPNIEYLYNISSFLNNFTASTLNNYEVRYRFKNTGNKGAGLMWRQNTSTENHYSFDIKIPGNTLIFAYTGYFYVNANANSGEFNEITVRYEKSNVNVWVNGKLIFKGNAVDATVNEVWSCLIHLPSDSSIDVDYIKVYQLP
jgi:hypothetical protein